MKTITLLDFKGMGSFNQNSLLSEKIKAEILKWHDFCVTYQQIQNFTFTKEYNPKS